MTAEAKLITVEFLKWVASRPRSFGEARAAWQSTCPSTCAWEDAISDGLVAFAAGERGSRALLVVTARGRALIGQSAEPPHSP
jgi:hypothetical protein